MVTKKSTINKLLEDSGMITHVKTLNILKKNGWNVLVSPYYYDYLTESVKETDLIAEKQFVSDPYGASDQLSIQLIIECKYIKQEIIFWMDKLNLSKIETMLEMETGLTKADDFFVHTDYHYFEHSEVGKIYSTDINNKDVIYKAVTQCLHSQLATIKEGKKPIFHQFSPKSAVRKQIITYPVIVCDNFDNLLKVSFENDASPDIRKITNNFLLEVNYQKKFSIIDIININALVPYLERMENEGNALVKTYGKRPQNR